jgi:hypothetical protein
VRVGRRWAVTAVPAVAFTLVAVVLAACGDSDAARATKAEWERRHGAAVGEVGRALDRVQAATKEGEPVGIRTNCEALRESVQEARAALPVPDAAADAALRQALDTMSTGVSDCLRAMPRATPANSNAPSSSCVTPASTSIPHRPPSPAS